MFDYGIGGQERKLDVNESIVDIPQNRTLLIEKLTADPALRPEIVEGLKTVSDVFQHFQPQQEVEFDTEDGSSISETLRFQALSDFGRKGVIAQSAYLQELNMTFEDLQRYVKQLKSNKILKTVLENPEAKVAYMSSIEAMIRELEEAKS
ncbi:hypothetical protein [Spirosoma pollinicola]|uniref:Type VI secretion system contractile sheath small subunit n=1 Tax=Spirosoma pollinicola TaxID=2057025 RepID=A0A2K8YTZ3_9BACT|nr:hypothetical protein [Spirosoma pollinicola]AUD01097.1 hypothetical protein CWM47_04215 [Spirosoma pollinicola]